MNWALLKNSLLVSGLATAAAVVLGLFAALWLAGLPRLWRRGLLMVAGLALVLPPFLVTGCWIALLGQTGLWRSWLPLNIYSLGGAAWVLALLNWPITLLLVVGAWKKLEPVLLESEPALQGWDLLRWLLWPLARTAVAQAAGLTFVLTLNNFAVPAILQVKIFPAELWVSFNTTFDYWSAIQLSWPLLVAPLALILCLGRREIAWPRLEGPVSARLFRQQLGGTWFWLSGIISATTLVVAVGIPLWQLTANAATWSQMLPALAAGRSAVVHTFMLAAVTATVCAGLGLVGSRWPLGLIWWLVFLMPGVLLGMALIYVFNRPPWLAFYHSLGIVVLAWTIRFLAVAWNGAAQARRNLDRALTEAAELDGASGWRLFHSIHWPQMAPMAAACWYLTFLFCLWDVETLILIMPPGGETVALRVFNLLHYGHNPQVNALCLWLLGLAALPALFWWLSRRCQRLLPVLPIALLFVGCGPETTSDSATLGGRTFSRAQIIGSRGTGLGQFNKPRSVAVDRQDHLYVVDMTARVQHFDANGVFLSSWQMPATDKGKPKGMDRDSLGNIIVVEPHYTRVNHFSTNGQLVSQWGRSGTNDGELAFPRAVAVNSRGELLLSEYELVERVQRFAPLGQRWLGSFGRPGNGPGEFNRAEGLGIDQQDRIYVADSCNHRIQVFDAQGRFLRAYGRPGSALGELSYPYDVRVDPSGLQFVCEFGNSRLQVFDPRDQPLEVIGGPGSLPGQFSNPWSIALDSKGNLYVADSGNHRVQKLIRRHPLRPS